MVVTAAVSAGSFTQQQPAPSLVDQADPTKSLTASSQPAAGQLIPKSEALWVDTTTKRVGINKPGADTNLHVVGTSRIQSNSKLSDNIAQGAFQLVDFNYTRGWSADSTGIQSYGGVLELNPRGLNTVELNNALRVLPNGNVGIGVANPAMQLDVSGVVRASDTIVSTKSAGAPFLIASTDLTKNLNADLLDGKSAEEFASAADLAALASSLQASGSSGSASTTVASLMDDGRFVLPETTGEVFDGHNGIVFPDGTLQTTAYEPVSAPQSQPIGTLLSVGGSVNVSASHVVALELEMEELGGPTGDPVRFRARLTKPLDELSGHLLVDLVERRGSYQNQEGSFFPNELLGDIVLTLPTLMVAPNGAQAAAGARIVLKNPRVIAIHQRPSKRALQPKVGPSSLISLEEIEITASDLRIESLDGSTLLASGGKTSPLLASAVSKDVQIVLSTAALTTGKGSVAGSPVLRSAETSVDLDSGSVGPMTHHSPSPETGEGRYAVIGPRLDLGVVHPLFLSSATSFTVGSWDAPLKRVIATVPMYSGGVNTPVHEIEMENVHARSWRLRSGAHGGFHVEVDLVSERQIRRFSAPSGSVQTVTLEASPVAPYTIVEIGG